MSDPFFFGEASRALFGILHSHRSTERSKDARKPACLVCPPLMQDAMRSQRALWQLSEALADARHEVLRFDWFGTGESMGESMQLRYEGMLADIDVALTELSLASQPSSVRILALRSAALPVLAHASTSRVPLDLVLWDPILDGGKLVESWQAQHIEQLTVAGRYPYGAPTSQDGDLMGHDVPEELLVALRSVDHARVKLPRGSRILLAAWVESPELSAFIDFQRAQGVDIDCLWLDASEIPILDQPRQFEAQLFPRKSVGILARQMAGAAA